MPSPRSDLLAGRKFLEIRGGLEACAFEFWFIADKPKGYETKSVSVQ